MVCPNILWRTETGWVVPKDVQHVMQQFSTQIFDSKILSLNIWGLPIIPIIILTESNVNVIFRASEHNFESSEFHLACDGHSNTITLIKSNFDNIFGGYTIISWPCKDRKEVDKHESFLFLLQSHDETQETPKIWNVKKYVDEVVEIWNDPHDGPGFGKKWISGYEIQQIQWRTIRIPVILVPICLRQILKYFVVEYWSED